MAFTIEMPSGRRISVPTDSALIGRDQGCQIALPDEAALQPIHAKIRKVADRWLIEAQGHWQLQVGAAPPGRMSWLQPGDVIRLTEAGPEIIFADTQPLPSAAPKHKAVPVGQPESFGVELIPAVTHPQTTPVPPARAAEWYYASNGQKAGPFSWEQFQQLANAGLLDPGDMVWKTGLPEWVAAGSVPALFPDGQAQAPLPPVAPPIPPAAVALSPEAASIPPGPAFVPPRIVASNPPKDPILMAVLSGLLPPLGQFLLGQKVKALVLFLTAPVLLGTLVAVTLGLGFFLLPLYSLLVAADAFLIAKKLRDGKSVGAWEFFGLDQQLLPLPRSSPSQPPQDMQAPLIWIAVTRLPHGLTPVVFAMLTVVGLAMALTLIGVFGMLFDLVALPNQILIALSFIHNAWALFALYQTVRLRKYLMAVVSSLLVMTCLGWYLFDLVLGLSLLGLLAGISVGFWSLTVLRKAEVRAAFGDQSLPAEAAWQRFSTPVIAVVSGGGLLTTILLAVGLLHWLTNPRPTISAPSPSEQDISQRERSEPRERREPRSRTIISRSGQSRNEIPAEFDRQDLTAADLQKLSPDELRNLLGAADEVVPSVKPNTSFNLWKRSDGSYALVVLARGADGTTRTLTAGIFPDRSGAEEAIRIFNRGLAGGAKK